MSATRGKSVKKGHGDSRPAERAGSQLDPVYVNARREALLVLAAWAVCLVWCVGYCWVFGYGAAGRPLETTLGMPSWVVWGVGVPWLGATVFSVWFGLAYMRDDDLGATADTHEPEHGPAGKEGIDAG